MKILKNGKWDGIWDRPQYQNYRNIITDFFKDLIFEEGPHKYYLHGQEITCVSNVTHIFKKPFNTEEMAQSTHDNHYNDDKSQYYHKSVNEIKQMWIDNSTRATTTGTARHNFGESCFYYMTGQYDKVLPEFQDRITPDGFVAKYPKEEAILDFWNDLPKCYVPILCENKTFREDLHYSGTFDILFYYDAELNGKKAKDSGFIIFDYKTNKNLYNNFQSETLLEPFDDMLSMDKSIYTLQLALYQLAIMQLGFKVIARKLIWLRDSGKYEKVPLVDVSKKMEDYLKSHPIMIEE